jgi:hypothetical protein
MPAYLQILLESRTFVTPICPVPGIPTLSPVAIILWYRQRMVSFFHARSVHHGLRRTPNNSYARIVGLLILPIVCTLSPRPTAAQQVQDVPTEEVVVNFAAGRVVIAVVKDAILIGTIENQIEPQTHPPTPVQMNRSRAGILLGAVDWFSPSSQLQLARLDTELPHLHGHFTAASPHLNQAQATAEATDLEALGQNLFERMNVVAGNLHGKLDWPSAEPVAQLILADYLQGYGPEVWELSFTLNQEMQRLDYYDTHISHPAYLQSWPPEKGQPHTLVEFSILQKTRHPPCSICCAKRTRASKKSALPTPKCERLPITSWKDKAARSPQPTPRNSSAPRSRFWLRPTLGRPWRQSASTQASIGFFARRQNPSDLLCRENKNGPLTPLRC